MVEVKHNESKYAQCNSCLATEDIYEVLIGKHNSNRMAIQLCPICMKSLIGQVDGKYRTDKDGLVYPVGTFKVGQFTCEVLAKYADKVEIMLTNTQMFSDYTILSILRESYGGGISVSNYSKGCVAAIPLENIIERGGLL